jgi:hypothetical protein
VKLPYFPPTNVAALYSEIQRWMRRANEIDPPGKK